MLKKNLLKTSIFKHINKLGNQQNPYKIFIILQRMKTLKNIWFKTVEKV